jgi:hypothetical protein
MLNGCGYLVFGSSTTAVLWNDLYPYRLDPLQDPEYKTGSYAQACARLVLLLTHSFFVHLTAVVTQLIPTIHSSNKSHKKFYIHNLLLIYRKAVHK